jgi:hypothetical protein
VVIAPVGQRGRNAGEEQKGCRRNEQPGAHGRTSFYKEPLLRINAASGGPIPRAWHRSAGQGPTARTARLWPRCTVPAVVMVVLDGIEDAGQAGAASKTASDPGP